MLNSTIDLPQHKRVFQIWNNDLPATDVHGTCNSDRNISKIRKIRYIRIKLSQLNVLLKSMLNTTIDLPQHRRNFEIWNIEKNNGSRASDVHGTCKSDKNIANIKKVREIHLELIKCAKNINDAYGLHNLMSVSLSFIIITVSCYNQYYYVKSMNYHQHPYISLLYSYWILHHVARIFIICYVCASTATEVYNFTLQLVQNPLSFTACGFFDLNNRLIYSVIGGVTTYLVILIQIGGTPNQILWNTNTNSTESTNY
ncbi:gustatory and pheromone receptor 32a-like [Polistes fuscatus]|uniref:gustatory and pheromone receptor 32a-like n=1 Tax=Polistes fuscatus TaxID=30207 RepID=UPI001CA997D0|nr:gustatory and pheromone receptor 32a-like [Polistes fuscatus]